MTHDMDPLLEEFRQAGEVDSSGRITLDFHKAVGRLSRSVLHDPAAWLVPAVAGMIGLGATRVRLKAGLSEFQLEGVGARSLSPHELSGILRLRGSAPLVHLGTGLLAALGRRPSRICLRSRGPDSHEVLIYERRCEMRPLPARADNPGLELLVADSRRAAGRLWARLSGRALPEVAALQSACRHSNFSVGVRRRRVDFGGCRVTRLVRGLAPAGAFAPGQVHSEVAHDRNWTALLGLGRGPGEAEPDLLVVNDGVLFAPPDALCQPGDLVRVVLWVSGWPTDLSFQELVRDPNFHLSIEEVENELDRMIEEIVHGNQAPLTLYPGLQARSRARPHWEGCVAFEEGRLQELHSGPKLLEELEEMALRLVPAAEAGACRHHPTWKQALYATARRLLQERLRDASCLDAVVSLARLTEVEECERLVRLTRGRRAQERAAWEEARADLTGASPLAGQVPPSAWVRAHRFLVCWVQEGLKDDPDPSDCPMGNLAAGLCKLARGGSPEPELSRLPLGELPLLMRTFALDWWIRARWLAADSEGASSLLRRYLALSDDRGLRALNQWKLDRIRSGQDPLATPSPSELRIGYEDRDLACWKATGTVESAFSMSVRESGLCSSETRLLVWLRADAHLKVGNREIAVCITLPSYLFYLWPAEIPV